MLLEGVSTFLTLVEHVACTSEGYSGINLTFQHFSTLTKGQRSIYTGSSLHFIYYPVAVLIYNG